MIKDLFVFAFKGLINRKLRSWLTMIGIFIGIAAVVSLISLGQGMQTAIGAQFASLGSDKILVQASGGFGPPGTDTLEPITTHDIDVIERVEGIKLVTRRILKSARIEFDDEVRYDYIATIPEDTTEANLVMEANSMEVEKGRPLKKGDKYKVLIGADYSTESAFDRTVKLGDRIIIQDTKFEVVGILKKTGSPNTDTVIFLPEESAKKIFDTGDELSMIIVQIADPDDVTRISDSIERAMRKDRGLKEGKENFQLQTPQQILETLNSILFVVQAILIGIAAISLIVGGIGIMNTMYTAVIERTKEIGIMKSIGAKNSDILGIFLIESGMLGIAGGIIGIIIGVIFSETVALGSRIALGTVLIEASFPWYLIVGALLFSFLVGSISGILPAIQASALQPVEALRYE